LISRLILEQVCDVETQLLLLSQFSSGFDNFSLDLSRQSGRNIGFDSNIAALISQLVLQDGSFNLQDFGFSGSSIGSNFIVPSGFNWNDSTSPQSVAELIKLLSGVPNLGGLNLGI